MPEDPNELIAPLEELGTRVITAVYLLHQAIVAVYNKYGQLIPGYQGAYKYAKHQILEDAPPETDWYITSSQGVGVFQKVTREQWAKI